MVTLVRAPNPSPMTLSGTNSYLLDCGDGTALAIDPGPAMAAHVATLVATAAAAGLRIAAIALTHGHADHSAAAPALAEQTQAVVYAHPRSIVARDADLPLEADFQIGSIALQTIDAPGHADDHAIFYLARERALFTGDTILGHGTTVVAPPGGAMRPYQRTLCRLRDEFADARTIYGGHGPFVADPAATIAAYIAHRRMREAQIVDALRRAPATIPQLVRRIYGPRRDPLWPAMARQVLAHLIALEAEGRVISQSLDREMTRDEAAMLNPRLEDIAAADQTAVMAAELGTDMRLVHLVGYRLVPG